MHSRAIAVATLLILGACAGNEENRPAQSAAPPPPPAPPAAQQSQTEMQGQPQQQQGMEQQTMPQQNADQNTQPTQPGMQAQTETPPAAEAMGDEQLIMISLNSHTHEVDEGRLAQQKAKDPRVKRFAGMMIQEHSLARDQEQKLVSRMKLKPQETDKSRQIEMKIEMKNRQDMDRLKTLTGTAFDRQYMQDQIEDHTEVLTFIDTKVLPNVKTQELKVHFEGLRPKIAKHLTEAQDLQRQIGTAPVSSR
jgi:putative membrane protein